MLLTKTPLRISLAGGGTDLPAAYRAIGGGAVVSFTIDKYVYIAVNPKFDGRVRVSHYDRNEVVDSVADVQHDLARACCQLLGVERGVEIVSVADIPAGTGLGSSSAYTVGVLHALHVLNRCWPSPAQLASEACQVEIDVLGHPIGKQDQYAAAFGGVRQYTFAADGSVSEARLDDAKDTNGLRRSLQSCLLLFYLGGTRQADAILACQNGRTGECSEHLRHLRALALYTADCLRLGADADRLGGLLRQGWAAKQQLAQGIGNGLVASALERATAAGATGGKLLGAGGTGFLLVCCAPEKREAVRAALTGLRELAWHVESRGSVLVCKE
jgi:D-glycero-alpha-D-manno-heptose-7-phosphate kinase